MAVICGLNFARVASAVLVSLVFRTRREKEAESTKQRRWKEKIDCGRSKRCFPARIYAREATIGAFQQERASGIMTEGEGSWETKTNAEAAMGDIQYEQCDHIHKGLCTA